MNKLTLCLMLAAMLFIAACSGRNPAAPHSQSTPTAVVGTDSVPIGTLIVKSGATILSSRTIWSRTAIINLNETLYMVVPRGSYSTVYFLPCRAGNWRLTYRQCYQLGDPGYINMYYAYTPGCVCTSTTSWVKMTTMTAFTWKRSQTFWCTNGNYGFRFDLIYPNCYYPCSGTDGDAIFELMITNA